MSPSPTSASDPDPSWMGALAKILLGSAGVVLAGLVGIGIFVGVALAVAYPNLPDVSALSDYRPKLPLRVYTADGVVIGEFGEERRNLTPIKDIPQAKSQAAADQLAPLGSIFHYPDTRSTRSNPSFP